MKWLAVALALAGCNQVLGLHSTHSSDAKMQDGLPDAPDGDGDGVPDAIDNCPTIANADQSDVDKDGVGDLCDNCPVIANPYQEQAPNDPDVVGDACDPHPLATTDCMILFDRFHDAGTFAAGWDVASKSMMPDISLATPSHMIITPHDANPVSITSKLVGSDRYDVEMIGSDKLQLGTLAIASNHSTTQPGYSCRLLAAGTTSNENLEASDGSQTDPGPMSEAAVSDRFVMRMVVPPSSASLTTTVSCRAEHGVAAGVVTLAMASELTAGQPGFVVSIDSTEIDAIAIYTTSPTAPCPTPIIR